jgi:hypothetical protein
LVLVFAEVHPFGRVTAEPIMVDIVSPAEAPPASKKEEPLPEKAQPSDSFDVSPKSAPSVSPAPAGQEPTARQQQQAALPALRPHRQQPNAQPQPQSPAPAPAFIPPEPDLSIKYHVLLGLPPDLPQGLPQDKPGDDFDAPASQTADVASSLVAEFRRHLKTCAKLPRSIEPSDPIKIKLRVFMRPDGRLATEPVLIEASASAKGLALMRSAIDALEACQPYAMLPAEKYGEWEMLDLGFTPLDFEEAS